LKKYRIKPVCYSPEITVCEPIRACGGAKGRLESKTENKYPRYKKYRPVIPGHVPFLSLILIHAHLRLVYHVFSSAAAIASTAACLQKRRWSKGLLNRMLDRLKLHPSNST